MPLNKAQLMEVPGGPGVIGAIKVGNGFSLADGIVSLNPQQQSLRLLAGSNCILDPSSGVGEVTISSTASVNAYEDDFPAGTRMIFANPSAPSGWTVVAGFSDMTVRLNSPGGGVTNSAAFSAIFTSYTTGGTASLNGVSVSGSTDSYNGTWSGSVSVSGNAGGTTLNASNTPSHSHAYTIAGQAGFAVFAGNNVHPVRSGTTSKSSGSTGGGSHSHSIGGSGSFSGNSNSHSHNVSGSVSGSVPLSGGNTIALNVNYVDFIVCSKN